MVNITSIRQRNRQFATERHEGPVCVFVGATSGIGAGTLERMVQMLHTPTIYVIGRSKSRSTDQLRKLEGLNPKCKLVFLEVEVSLLSDVDLACKRITAVEQKVDYLFMSQGFFPLIGPQYTKEHLDLCFSLSYYSRMRFIYDLLPHLRKSPKPRILSVLNGGKEGPMNLEDVGLQQHWSTFNAVNHTTTMMTLALEHLAKADQQITFMHAAPGIVKTDIFAKLEAPKSSSLLWRALLVIARGLAALAMLIIGMSVEDCGERQVFYLTNSTFTPGAWCISASSDMVSGPRFLDQYRAQSWQEKIWEHTLRVFDTALSVDE